MEKDNEIKTMYKHKVMANDTLLCYVYTTSTQDYITYKTALENNIIALIIKYFFRGALVGIFAVFLTFAKAGELGRLSNKQLSTLKELKSHVKDSVNREILASIALVESSLDPAAVGTKKEVGLFQLHPRYFKIEINAPIKTQVLQAEKHLNWLKNACKFKTRARLIVAWNRGCRGAKKLALSQAQNNKYFKKFIAASKELNNGSKKKFKNSRAFSSIEFKIAKSHDFN